MITTEPGVIYRIELSFNKQQTFYNCSENVSSDNDNNEFNDDELSDLDEELKEELYWDNKLYSYKNYRYNWRQRENPCNDAYYGQNRMIAQNLLASNLGVIAKKGVNNSYFFAVTNILNTNPEASAKVQLFNLKEFLEVLPRGKSGKFENLRFS